MIVSRGLAVIVAPLVIFKLCWYGRDISAVERSHPIYRGAINPSSLTTATGHSPSDSSDACHEAYHCLRAWYAMKYLAWKYKANDSQEAAQTPSRS